jgi:hypothetical protein
MDELKRAIEADDIDVVLLKKARQDAAAGEEAGAAPPARSSIQLSDELVAELAASEARGSVVRRSPTSMSLPKRTPGPSDRG